MKNFIHKRFISISVFAVICLILLALIVTYQNNKIIDENIQLQKQAERVKVTVSQFAIIIIHNLDIGLRGYALYGDEKYLNPLWFAIRDKDSLLQIVEKELFSQEYPLGEFNILRDSINAYADFCLKLKRLYDRGQMEEFHRLGNLNKGYQLWLQYESFTKKIYQYEDKINTDAIIRYNAAMKRDYIIQILLFIICLPTLLFTAYHSNRKFAITEKLRQTEAEKALLLLEQTKVLEQKVEERTKEIQLKNHELSKQNEEIENQNEKLISQGKEISNQRDLLANRNEELNKAQTIIKKQNEQIILENEKLEERIAKKTNQLVLYNRQLEQFAFLAAHNLRAPVARIMGLGNLFTLNPNITNQETKIIISMLTAATKELDEVIQDLSSVLELRDNISKSIATVNFSAELELIISNLEKEIVETNTIIEASFVEAPEVIAVKAYIDSILFNLINNAIKYRQADRSPVVKIKSYTIPKYICLAISDNGVGIPKKHLNKIFNFYSRFHFHVGGKGLGLFLVNSQVMAMGGIVKVKSKINEGTTFKIYFRKNLKKSQHQLSKKMLSIPNEKG